MKLKEVLKVLESTQYVNINYLYEEKSSNSQILGNKAWGCIRKVYFGILYELKYYDILDFLEKEVINIEPEKNDNLKKEVLLIKLEDDIHEL